MSVLDRYLNTEKYQGELRDLVNAQILNDKTQCGLFLKDTALARIGWSGSDSPDLKAYQKICKEHNAYLLIDCAHDFGHIGEKGRGFWDVQGLTDLSNVLLLGTGSKCLSTNIGFVGCNDPRVI